MWGPQGLIDDAAPPSLPWDGSCSVSCNHRLKWVSHQRRIRPAPGRCCFQPLRSRGSRESSPSRASWPDSRRNSMRRRSCGCFCKGETRSGGGASKGYMHTLRLLSPVSSCYCCFGRFFCQCVLRSIGTYSTSGGEYLMLPAPSCPRRFHPYPNSSVASFVPAHALRCLPSAIPSIDVCD